MALVLNALIVAAPLTIMVDLAMSMPTCDFVKISEKQIAKQFPRFDLKELRQVISENGHLWELTYEMPETSLGGVPIVTIDKRTCKIVRIVHTQ